MPVKELNSKRNLRIYWRELVHGPSHAQNGIALASRMFRARSLTRQENARNDRCAMQYSYSQSPRFLRSAVETVTRYA